MNLASYIYRFLQTRNSRAEIPHFGSFTIQKKPATLNKETSKMLPPKDFISFEENTLVSDEKLANYIAKKTGKSTEFILSQIANTVELWKQKLEKERILDLGELGVLSFSEEKKYILNSSNSLQNFFGLEEIELEEIQTVPNKKSEKTNRKSGFNLSIIWAFLVLATVVGLGFLAFEHQELIFGKKSFQETSPKKIEKPIIKPDSVTIDSIHIEYETRKAPLKP